MGGIGFKSLILEGHLVRERQQRRGQSSGVLLLPVLPGHPMRTAVHDGYGPLGDYKWLLDIEHAKFLANGFRWMMMAASNLEFRRLKGYSLGSMCGKSL